MYDNFISSPSGILLLLANAIAVLINQPGAANYSQHLTLLRSNDSRDQRVITSIDNDEAEQNRRRTTAPLTSHS